MKLHNPACSEWVVKFHVTKHSGNVAYGCGYQYQYPSIQFLPPFNTQSSHLKSLKQATKTHIPFIPYIHLSYGLYGLSRTKQ